MKKIYLLLAFCCLYFVSPATKWYSLPPALLLPGRYVTVPANWNSNTAGTGAVYTGTFAIGTDTFIVQSGMQIPASGTWNVAGTLMFSTVPGSQISFQGGVTNINFQNALWVNNSGLITTPLAGAPGTFNVNVYGNLFVTDSGRFDPGGMTGTTVINLHFADTSGAVENIVWTSADTSRFTALIFDRRSYRQLLSDVHLPIKTVVSDSLLGTLICGTFKMYSDSTDTFTIKSGATLYTANSGGLDSTLKMLYTRHFSGGANYIYNGSLASQVTGVTLPSHIVYPGSVTIDNPAGVQMSSVLTSFDTGSSLNLEYGTFHQNGNVQMNAGSNVNVDNGAFQDPPNYGPMTAFGHGVNITYENLGFNSLVFTTGKELTPITAHNTIGKLTVNKPGAAITFSPSLTVYINDSVNLVAGTLDAAAIPNSANVYAYSHWVNYAGPGAFIPEGSDVLFSSAAATQIIGGTYSTTFFNLAVSNSNGVAIADTEYVNGTLDFVSGKVAIGANELIFGPSAAPVVGAGLSTYIINNTSGHVRKQFAASTTTPFLLPVGDLTNYTPFTINSMSAGSFAPNADAGVNLKTVKQPNNLSAANYLNRYWRVKVSGMSGFSYSASASYVPADVVPAESLMSMGEFHGVLPWLKFSPANTTTHTITTGTGTVSDTLADFTGISTQAPTVTSSPSVRICEPSVTSTTLTVLSGTGDAPLSYTWSPAGTLSTATGTTVTASPTTTTTYTVTVTDGNGFKGTSTTTVGVDATPYLLGGVATSSPLCVGDDLYLFALTPVSVTSFLWTGPAAITSGGTTSAATVHSVTTAASGVYTVSLTNGSDPGCAASYTTAPVVVNTPPAGAVASGAGTFCLSTLISATTAGSGTIMFQGTTRGGTSTSLGGTPQTVTATGTYYFRTRNMLTGCWGQEDSVHVVINPLPTPYNMIGGGDYCAGTGGLPIGLAGSDHGVIYRLYINGIRSNDSLRGIGDTLHFGTFDTSGSYNVFARDTITGCTLDFSTVTTSATIIIDPLPTPYTMNASGGYCLGSAGYDVGLNWSDPGLSYQLYFKDTAAASVFAVSGAPFIGTSAPLDWGLETAVGKYAIIATNPTTHCTSPMVDTEVVSVNPLPHVYTVSGGGTDCADGPGFPISLDTSRTGTKYYLYVDGALVDSLNGTGHTLHFTNENTTGTYTVTAMDGNGCVNNMAGSGYIQANPLPATFTMSPLTASYCAGSPVPATISLASSEDSVTYRLYINGVLDTTIAGTGSFLVLGSFTTPGTYVLKATNDTSGCVTADAGGGTGTTISINPLPDPFIVYGSGSYCAGGAGVDLHLTGSQSAPVSYLLYVDSVYSLISVPGDGSSPFDLGFQTTPGTYTVVASNTLTGCTLGMADSAVIVEYPVPPAYNVTGSSYYCGGDSTHNHVRLTGSDTGISYQLYLNGSLTGTPMTGTGDTLDFGSKSTPGTYTIVASNVRTHCTSNMTGSAVITSFVRPHVYTVSGGGAYCTGGAGVPVNISGTEPHVTYQLYDTTAIVGGTLSGTGAPGTFGPQTMAGHYTVIAANDTTGCTDTMAGSAFVVVRSLPPLFLVAGGGPYCAGDTGRHVYLAASISSAHYQLYRGGTAIGSPHTGTGAGLDFGLFTTAGTYTVFATDTVTTCARPMDSMAVITINSLPPVYAVSGGGAICAGAPGDTVFVSGSSAGIRYLLHRGSSIIDSLMGTGSAINFGPRTTAGTYTVVGRNPYTNCTSNMTGSAPLVVKPVPGVFNVTGGGSFCVGGPGVHVGLSGSDTIGSGVQYQLINSLGGPVAAPEVCTGGTVDFGLVPTAGVYRAYAYFLPIGVGCVDTMSGSITVDTTSLPAVHLVTGGGTYCAGDTGVHVGLNGTDTGIVYQLYHGPVADSTPLAGTGGPIDFGLTTAVGVYSVSATNSSTGCMNGMSGSVNVASQPYFTPAVTLTAHPGTTIYVGDLDTVIATVSGAGVGTPTYQWVLNGNIIPGATSDTFVFSIYFDNDSIVCNVTSTGTCGGVTTSKLIFVSLRVNAVKQILANSSDIRLMPNPNKGVFNLKGTLGTQDDQELTIEVSNTLGQVVYKGRAMAKNGMVDERIGLDGSLANGMYLLNLRSGSINSVIHFVVEQ